MWAPLGTGLGFLGGSAMTVLPNGDVGGGGAFVTGGLPADRIARWKPQGRRTQSRDLSRRHTIGKCSPSTSAPVGNRGTPRSSGSAPSATRTSAPM